MKILVLGHNPNGNSTFSRITKHILEVLQYEEIYLLAKDAFANKEKNLLISPIFDLPKQFEESIDSFQPDIVLTIGNLQDHLIVYNYTNIMSYSWKWVSIPNIPTMPFNTDLINILFKIDYILTFNNKSFNIIKSFNQNTSYAHLGVESSFFPFINQNEMKRDVFTIISPGSNSKNNYKIALLEAFGIFSRGKENDVLLYFCDRNQENYYNLNDLLWKLYSYRKLIMLNNSNCLGDIFNDSMMNSNYNMAHVCIDTNTDDNFQLSNLEALKCGCEVILPDSSHIIADYPKSHQNRIHAVKTNQILNKDGSFRNHIEIEGLVEKLNELYIRYKKVILNSIEIQDCLDFNWEEFNKELKYIIGKLQNINKKEIVSLKI